jgi:hypothetical protein
MTFVRSKLTTCSAWVWPASFYSLATLFSPEEGDGCDGAYTEGNCQVGSAMVPGTSRTAAPLPLA